MKRKQYLHDFIGYLFLFVFLSGCQKFIEIDPPETQAELSKIFADEQTAIAAVSGLYSQMSTMNSSLINGGVTIYSGLAADELITVSPNASYDNFSNNNLLSNNSIISNNFWREPYANIYHANTILEGLEASTKLSPALKERLRGEVLYVRAIYYFYLVNLFGPVPYQTSSNYEVNAIMPRTDVNKIYEGITADLKEAKILLERSGGTNDNLHANKDAVTSLLARIYLYLKDWNNAAEMATQVIGSGRYILDDPASSFLLGSKETIFQLYRQRFNTAEAGYLLPASGTVRPLLKLRDQLINSFETGDCRKLNWTKSNTVAGVVYTYPYKYKTRAQTPITEYLVVQRLAELYLIRAEARANLNNLEGAIDDVDQIRGRALISKLKEANPAITKAQLLDAIAHENQLEFFAEWGHRWLDLKRLGKADEVIGGLKGSNWKPTAKLYPIPFAQIQLNVFLTQNDGYND